MRKILFLQCVGFQCVTQRVKSVNHIERRTLGVGSPYERQCDQAADHTQYFSQNSIAS
jgi:hypothetical protein